MPTTELVAISKIKIKAIQVFSTKVLKEKNHEAQQEITQIRYQESIMLTKNSSKILRLRTTNEYNK